MNSGIHDAHALAAALAASFLGAVRDPLERYARQRRDVAINDVQVRSSANYHWHRERDPDRRARIWRNLQGISKDRERMREFLLQSSMIASIRH